ncbi:hypothetical protein [Nonomuraea dietziae]|uniref:hypothetical protein n=1 Tax=Nonomuraea dietziae TaxID=65515 RepID=UPI0031CFD5C5
MRDGKVSVEGARTDYGVVFEEGRRAGGGRVDVPATAALRARLAEEPVQLLRTVTRLSEARRRRTPAEVDER